MKVGVTSLGLVGQSLLWRKELLLRNELLLQLLLLLLLLLWEVARSGVTTIISARWQGARVTEAKAGKCQLIHGLT